MYVCIVNIKLFPDHALAAFRPTAAGKYGMYVCTVIKKILPDHASAVGQQDQQRPKTCSGKSGFTLKVHFLLVVVFRLFQVK